MRRFYERKMSVEPTARAARELIRDPGPAELARMYDRLMDTIAARPDVKVVRTVNGQVERAYRDFLASLAIVRS
ncbi:MAG TPA: hypothetical protein VGM14_07740 [Streptosporangiaceae bacterium]